MTIQMDIPFGTLAAKWPKVKYTRYYQKKKHMNKQTNTYNNIIMCNKYTVPIKSLMPHLYDRRASELQLNEKGPTAISISSIVSLFLLFFLSNCPILFICKRNGIWKWEGQLHSAILSRRHARIYDACVELSFVPRVLTSNKVFIRIV